MSAASDLDASRFWLDALKWDEQGMIPAIAQDAASGRVVMFAWMNRESLQQTVATGNAVYWSRSRARLWRKGEESGHFQKVISIRADCDGDVLLLAIEPRGWVHVASEPLSFSPAAGWTLLALIEPAAQ